MVAKFLSVLVILAAVGLVGAKLWESSISRSAPAVESSLSDGSSCSSCPSSTCEVLCTQPGVEKSLCCPEAASCCQEKSVTAAQLPEKDK